MAKGTNYGTRENNSIIAMGDYGKESPIKMVSAAQNMEVTKRQVKNWYLGPEEASENPKANKMYWMALGKAMNGTGEAEARRRLCANCEYFDNTPEMQKAMESVAMNKFDMDGGGRGFCNKFDFICHNLRACQGWEKKRYYLPS